MPYQLAFALEPPKYAGPQGIAAFGRFARSVEALKPLVLKDLAGPTLTVNVTSTTGPVIARVYLQQGSVGLPAVNRSWCAVLVVLSGQNAPATFTAQLPGSMDGGVPAYVTTAASTQANFM